jgi:hypothetical protein
LAAYYDLTISHPAVRQVEFTFFDDWLAAAAAEYGLSCALIHDGIVLETVRRLSAGEMAIGFHLDYYALWHRSTDPYARLAEAVQDAGGRSVNAPARARTFTDKASAHFELLRHGLGAPATVIVRPWTPERPFTASERIRLRLDEPGAAVFIKPANGFGGRGVKRVDRTDAGSLAAALAAARQHDPQDSYLIQREVRPPLLPCEDGCDRPAYWRVLCCQGEWMLFWWTTRERCGAGQPSYRMVTAAEMHRHRLQPVLAYARALGELSGLEWFSTELCLSDGPDDSCFSVRPADGLERPIVAIDYLNDQCAVDVQSRWPGALPDRVVQHVARRFVETAWRLRQQSLRPVLSPEVRRAA